MYKYLSFLLVIFHISNINASELRQSKGTEQSVFCNSHFELLIDSTGKKDISTILKSNDFITRPDFLNFGLSDVTIWLKLDLSKLDLKDKERIIIENATLDFIAFYQTSQSRVISSDTVSTYNHFYKRKHHVQIPVFDLQNIDSFDNVIYFQIKSNTPLLVPTYIGNNQEISNRISNKELFEGIYLGIILAIFLYNLFIFISSKDKDYFYYVVYLITIGFTQLVLLGYLYRLFPNYNPFISKYLIVFSGIIVGAAVVEFTRNFLRIKRQSKNMNSILNGFIVIYIISAILTAFGMSSVAYNIVNAVAGIGGITLLIMSIVLLKRGSKQAKFFIVGWSVFLGCVIIYVVKDYGSIPYNSFTKHALLYGSAFEAIVFSFALADKLNIFRKEKEQARANEIHALKETQELIKNQNIILEEKIEVRTHEIQEVNDNLNLTLNDLKSAQNQLVNSEKMASLGQLTAGIAHEINNPINFVSSNISPLRLDLNDLYSLLDKYSEIENNDSLEEKLNKIEAFKKEIDLDFIKKEIEELISGIDEGARRTREIVKGLRNFSRLDEGDLKKANINDGIKSTLAILKSEMNKIITIELNLEDNMILDCFPGKLNQVFLNIINNSIYAVLHNNRAEKIITISTFLEDDDIYISIKDNGLGIPESIINKVFDPFFTTKDVGEGTGLGLSIVYTIIKSHNGHVIINTKAGQETEFLLKLPRNSKIG